MPRKCSVHGCAAESSNTHWRVCRSHFDPKFVLAQCLSRTAIPSLHLPEKMDVSSYKLSDDKENDCGLITVETESRILANNSTCELIPSNDTTQIERSHEIQPKAKRQNGATNVWSSAAGSRSYLFEESKFAGQL